MSESPVSESPVSDPVEVRPFAFMRLTHEAVRYNVARCLALARQLCEEPDLVTASALRERFDELRRAFEVHARIEDRGFFPLLDAHFGPVCAQAGFGEDHRHEHGQLAQLALAIDGVATTRDRSEAETLRDHLLRWAEEVADHLVREEDVVMPLAGRVSDTVEGQGAAVRAIIDTDRADVERILVPWVLRGLDASQPLGPVRMFVLALRASHDDDAWARIAPGLRAALSATTVGALDPLGALR